MTEAQVYIVVGLFGGALLAAIWLIKRISRTNTALKTALIKAEREFDDLAEAIRSTRQQQLVDWDTDVLLTDWQYEQLNAVALAARNYVHHRRQQSEAVGADWKRLAEQEPELFAELAKAVDAIEMEESNDASGN